MNNCRLPTAGSAGTAPETAAPSPAPAGSSYLLLALLWLLYTSFGLVTRATPALVTPIIDDLGLSYARMGVILGSWQLTFVPGAMIAGLLLDRWGIYRSIALGGLIMAASALLRAQAVGFWTLLAAVGLFGLGAPMISVGGPKALAYRFVGPARSQALGAYMTGPWLGGTLSLAMTRSVVVPAAGGSWRWGLATYGFVVLALTLLWLAAGRFEARTVDPDTAGPIRTLGLLIRAPRIRVLLGIGLTSFTISHGFSNWMPKLLETQGLSPARAGLWASMSLLFAVPGALFGPRFIPARHRPAGIAAMAGLVAVSMIALGSGHGAGRIVWLALFGITSTLFVPLSLLILMDSPDVPPRILGAAGGAFFCVAEIGGFSGPWLLGVIKDFSGGFAWGIGFLVGLAVLIAVLALALDRFPPGGSPNPDRPGIRHPHQSRAG